MLPFYSFKSGWSSIPEFFIFFLEAEVSDNLILCLPILEAYMLVILVLTHLIAPYDPLVSGGNSRTNYLVGHGRVYNPQPVQAFHLIHSAFKHSRAIWLGIARAHVTSFPQYVRLIFALQTVRLVTAEAGGFVDIHAPTYLLY